VAVEADSRQCGLSACVDSSGSSWLGQQGMPLAKVRVEKMEWHERGGTAWEGRENSLFDFDIFFLADPPVFRNKVGRWNGCWTIKDICGITCIIFVTRG
jgi:predicted oxidoreductase